MSKFKILALSILCATLVSEYSCASSGNNIIIADGEEDYKTEQSTEYIIKQEMPKQIVHMLLDRIFELYYSTEHTLEGGEITYANKILDCLRNGITYDNDSSTYIFIRSDNTNELSTHNQSEWKNAETLYYDFIFDIVKSSNIAKDKFDQNTLLSRVMRLLNELTFEDINTYFNQYLSKLKQPDMNLDNTTQSDIDSYGFYQSGMD